MKFTGAVQQEIDKLVASQNNLIRVAVESLRRRIAEPDAAEKGFGPDGMGIESDYIARQLLDRGQYQLAAHIYVLLANETVIWRESADQPRHAGRFFANLGGAVDSHIILTDIS